MPAAASQAAAAPPAAASADTEQLSPADLKKQLAAARAELTASLTKKRAVDRNLVCVLLSLPPISPFVSSEERAGLP